MKYHITHHIRFILIFMLLAQLPSCTHRKDIAKETLHINTIKKDTSCAIAETSITPPPITIWVHGTIIFYKSFYQDIFKKQSGLFLAKDLPFNHYFHLLAKTIIHNDPTHYSLEEFYIFAWSGRLSIKDRKMAAEKLYQELHILIEQYKQKYHCNPSIQIIAHSHGGNVVLHMAKIDNLKTLSIQSLILLACPVQEKTMYLISMPMFQRIYSLYSSIDFIQIIAPQLRYHIPRYLGHRRYKLPAFSSRLFPSFPHVIQTKIKLNGYPITHTRFSTLDFIEMLPTILKKLDSWDEIIQKENIFHKYKLLCLWKN